MTAESRSRIPWYERAFGKYYPVVYAHRSDEEARAAIDVLRRRVSLEGARVVDVACGNGRHLRALGGAGRLAVGLDLSRELLAEAARGSGESGYRLLQADMRRIPLGTGTADLVLFMFTSLGYFETEEENRGVLRELARILARGGHLFLDYLNYRRVVASLVPRSERTSAGHLVREERRLVDGGRRLIKSVRVLRGGSVVQAYEESLLLFRPAELDDLLVGAGFTPVERFGGEEGHPFDEERSARYIVLARRGG